MQLQLSILRFLKGRKAPIAPGSGLNNHAEELVEGVAKSAGSSKGSRDQDARSDDLKITIVGYVNADSGEVLPYNPPRLNDLFNHAELLKGVSELYAKSADRSECGDDDKGSDEYDDDDDDDAGDTSSGCSSIESSDDSDSNTHPTPTAPSKRKKRKRSELTCTTCNNGFKTKKCKEYEKDCGGYERIMCKCGRRAQKNGVCCDVNCWGEGYKPKDTCKVDGCTRQACKDGICRNKQCTGRYISVHCAHFPVVARSMLWPVARIPRGSPGSWDGVESTEKGLVVSRKGVRIAHKQELGPVSGTMGVFDAPGAGFTVLLEKVSRASAAARGRPG